LEQIPEDIRRFLLTHIASVEQLEILRVLGESPAREWTDDEVRQQAQVSAESIHAHLQGMNEHGLLRCRKVDSKIVCGYGPHSAELEAGVRRLLDVYRQFPVTMIRLVYKSRTSSLDAFADAFRIRSKE